METLRRSVFSLLTPETRTYRTSDRREGSESQRWTETEGNYLLLLLPRSHLPRSIWPGRCISTLISCYSTTLYRLVRLEPFKVSLRLSLCLVDAHVGRALFHNVIAEARNEGKTVIFVTHALHFLSHCDYIYTLSNGHIAEQGTFEDLVAAEGELAHLLQEFGGGSAESLSDEGDEESPTPPISSNTLKKDVVKASEQDRLQAAGTGKIEGKLMIKEQRQTGSISNNGELCPSLLLARSNDPCLSLWTVAQGGIWFLDHPLITFRNTCHARDSDLGHIYFGMVESRVRPKVQS